MKKESSGAGARATLMKTKSSGAGATFMKRRAADPELCHFYDGSAALNNPHCSRAHKLSRVKIQQIKFNDFHSKSKFARK